MSHHGVVEVTRFRAAIFDMDGVVTQTATVHAQAWKAMFDAFLQRYYAARNEPFRPFDVQDDYFAYVDGLPRHAGVRNFLQSRAIELPEGSEDDAAECDTVHGLGQRKDAMVQEVLARDGVEVFDDWREAFEQWRVAGMKSAIVSSSLNCQAMIRAAGIEPLFDARVDGAVSRELGLKGKPDPDIFIEAARRLGEPPAACVVFEDAISGVQAGAAGEFGLVVGVARHGNHDDLARHGAQVTVTRLTELSES
ncbi:hydrolase [Halorhodospira abdelmalekii]|uniref:beta-phosphoglucomutase family hydrolase n=1 Tax=Halorhodospira abdelmalekii TaxID=421629 RepID=UPI001903EBBF|nr:beta-phosphoglucomutase family hydrolase [Halorhodospira abdelmalekii]MBK1735256.1 hydrolase [Halorhodospira abdelmalekii]